MILKEKRFIDFIIYPNQLHLSLLSFINTTLGVSNLCLKLYAGFGYEAIYCSPKLGQVVKVELINLSKKSRTWESRAGASSAQTSRQK